MTGRKVSVYCVTHCFLLLVVSMCFNNIKPQAKQSQRKIDFFLQLWIWRALRIRVSYLARAFMPHHPTADGRRESEGDNREDLIYFHKKTTLMIINILPL